jgi:hypothetical protein
MEWCVQGDAWVRGLPAGRPGGRAYGWGLIRSGESPAAAPPRSMCCSLSHPCPCLSCEPSSIHSQLDFRRSLARNVVLATPCLATRSCSVSEGLATRSLDPLTAQGCLCTHLYSVESILQLITPYLPVCDLMSVLKHLGISALYNFA